MTNPVEYIARLCAPLLCAFIIAWLSLTSSPPQIPGVLGWDKFLHASAYGLLTFLVVQFLLYLSFQPGTACWCAVVAAVGFGAALEILQFMTHAGRTAEWWDLVADAVGACLVWLLFQRSSVLRSLVAGTAGRG